jgi:hypothetical protein
MAAPLNAGRQDEARADQGMARAGGQFIGIAPERGEQTMSAPERVSPKLRHAEIRRFADDFDVSKKKAYMRDIDVEHGGLDIDRHIWLRQCAFCDERARGAAGRR